MKKILALLLCVCMLAFALVACNTPDEEPAVEAEYKLGMGIVVNADSSATGNAQVDATVATVVTDKDGKIVACRIDVAQNKMNVADGVVDTTLTFQTKMEKGDAYGMAGKVDNDGNGVMKEWYDQTKAFEAYVVGKTAAQVQAIQTQEVNGHQIAVDEALLNAGCSMQITDFIAAVVAACNDTQAATFKTSKSFTLGVAASTTAAESTSATTEKDGSVNMYTDFAATVIIDGKIAAALNDAIQPKIAINNAGEIGTFTYVNPKRVLKEGYGMAGKVDNNGDGVMKEWYLQSEAFSKYVVGKTAAEVTALQTQLVNGHYISVDEALLSAGCTIQITGIQAVMAKAATNAR